jgi:hypothetical protein
MLCSQTGHICCRWSFHAQVLHASHRIASHRIASHRIASHRMHRMYIVHPWCMRRWKSVHENDLETTSAVIVWLCRRNWTLWYRWKLCMTRSRTTNVHCMCDYFSSRNGQIVAKGPSTLAFLRPLSRPRWRRRPTASFAFHVRDRARKAKETGGQRHPHGRRNRRKKRECRRPLKLKNPFLGRIRTVKKQLRIDLKLLFTNLGIILNYNYIRQSWHRLQNKDS